MRPRVNRSGRIIPFAALGLMGAVFLGVGLFVGLRGPAESREMIARAERQAPLDAAAFEESPPGRPAVVAGALSPRNRPRFRDFVAYTREEYHGTDDQDREQWDEDERVTPPLLIDLAGGAVQIGNSDYQLRRAHDTWQDSPGPSYSVGMGTKRYSGLVAGRPVVIVGTIVAGREGRELRADLIFAGDRAAYIASLREDGWVASLLGGIFGAAGALLIAIALLIILRR
jgi:hypothetical protein